MGECGGGGGAARKSPSSAPLLAQPAEPVLADDRPLLAAVHRLDLGDLDIRVRALRQLLLHVKQEVHELLRTALGAPAAELVPGRSHRGLLWSGAQQSLQHRVLQREMYNSDLCVRP